MNKSQANALRNRNKLRRQFGQLFDDCVREFYRADPIQLAPSVPIDEYDVEVGTVLPRLKECSGPADVQRVLHEEFCRWFNPEIASPSSKYEVLSHRIWALYLKDADARAPE